MGWKTVKEHYAITHIVCVVDGKIRIGSAYISDLIVIDETGKIIKFYSDGRPGSNDDLARYERQMLEDPEKLRQCVVAKDNFDQSVTVYTYAGANIFELQCERPGWPNVTHDGQLMYENLFSTDHAYIVAKAKSNAKSGVAIFERRTADLEEQLAEASMMAAQCRGELASLKERFPEANDDVDD